MRVQRCPCITDMRSAYCSLDIQASSPERRQTKDFGEPNLYEVTAELCRGERRGSDTADPEAALRFSNRLGML